MLLVSAEEFHRWYAGLGADGEVEPIPAAPLHNTHNIQLVVSDSIPGTAVYMRTGRQWYRLRPPVTDVKNPQLAFQDLVPQRIMASEISDSLPVPTPSVPPTKSSFQGKISK